MKVTNMNVLTTIQSFELMIFQGVEVASMLKYRNFLNLYPSDYTIIKVKKVTEDSSQQMTRKCLWPIMYV